jgi:hypothetical protein
VVRVSSRPATTQGTVAGEVPGVVAAWEVLQDALPPGWRAHPPTYDPDAQRWSVWAVPRPPIAVHPVRGGGATEAMALADLAASLRARFG